MLSGSFDSTQINAFDDNEIKNCFHGTYRVKCETLSELVAKIRECSKQLEEITDQIETLKLDSIYDEGEENEDYY